MFNEAIKLRRDLLITAIKNLNNASEGRRQFMIDAINNGHGDMAERPQDIIAILSEIYDEQVQ